MFFLLGCVGTTTRKKQTSEKLVQNITVTGIKYAYSYDHQEMMKYIDHLNKYNVSIEDDMASLDSLVFDKQAPYGFIRYDHYTYIKTGKRFSDTTRFVRYVPTKRDSLLYMPDKILDFELQGIYMNNEEDDGDDVDRFGTYLNPKTNDVLQLVHMFYVGNPYCIFVFAHDDTTLFKGKESLLRELLRLDKTLDTVNHIQMNFHITNNKIDSVNVTEH